MKMAYVLGKWDEPVIQKHMLSRNLRGELTEPKSNSQPTNESASMEMTRALGRMLLNAEAAGLASRWAERLVQSLMFAAARIDDVDMLEQLLRMTGHFEVWS